MSQCLSTIILKDICAVSFSSLEGCYLNHTQTPLLGKKKIWILKFPFKLRNSFLHSNTRCNLLYSVRLTAVIGLETKKVLNKNTTSKGYLKKKKLFFAKAMEHTIYLQIILLSFSVILKLKPLTSENSRILNQKSRWLKLGLLIWYLHFNIKLYHFI